MTAEGAKAFASGTDISNFKDFHSAQDAIDYEAMIGRVIEAVQTASVPVIASLHGVVAGGGAAIAAAADIRLGTPDTKFGMPIARTLGNCLSIANLNRLIHLLGESRTRYLLLTAEFLPIAPMVESGFVSEVIDNAELCEGSTCEGVSRAPDDVGPAHNLSDPRRIKSSGSTCDP